MPETLPETKMLALADDLTGALEVAGLFAAAGAQTIAGIECAPPAQVSVADLETRHLGAEVAADRVREFASVARERGARFIFLKIDSTMRGPIGAELKALRDVWPDRPVFLTPAYPKLGRTVRNGELFIDGRPLSETAFARDPTHPARASRIEDLIAISSAGVIVSSGVPAEPVPGAIYALDAVSDGDLAEIVCTLRDRDLLRVAVGSGGLARQLASLLPVHRAIPQPLPRVARPLVASGSMHAISIGQLERAGSWPVLACGEFSDGREALASIARRAYERILADSIDTIVVFGGDTARALMEKLNIREIEPIGEALPGVPVSRIVFENRPLTLITKAGGFGGPDLLPKLAAALGAAI